MAAALLWGGTPCEALLVSLTATEDTAIYASLDATNQRSAGGGESVVAGRTGPNQGGGVRRSLFWFDLSSLIPTGAVIQAATLRLTVDKSERAGPVTMSLFRLTNSWGEGTVAPSAGQGQGGPAEPGDGTWLFRFASTSSWITAGGDFVATPSATQAVGGALDAPIWSGAGMVADVQSWVDGVAPNHGWILLGPEGFTSAKSFASSENLDVGARPLLTVTYVIPEPGAVAGMIAALAGAAALRRRSAKK